MTGLAAQLRMDRRALAETLPLRLRHAMHESRFGVLLVLPAALLAWLILGGEVPTARLVAWVALLCGAYVLRIGLDRLYARRAPPASQALAWTRALCAVNATTGVAWSLLSWYVVRDAAWDVQAAAVIVLVGVVTVGLQAYAVLPAAYAWFAAAVLAPPTATVLAHGHAPGRLLGATIAVFAVMLVAVVMRTTREFARRTQLEEEVSQLLRRYAHATERLTRTIEASRAILWEADLADGTMYVSEGWAELAGGPAGPTRTTIAALAAITHPEDLPEASRRQVAALKGEFDEYESEQRVLAVGGEWRWLVTRGRVTARDPASGRALRMSGTTRDVTQRKHAQERLADSEQRYRALAGRLEREVAERTQALAEREFLLRLVTDNVPVALAYFDADAICRFANRQYVALLGRDRVEEVVGRPVAELLSPERRERIAAQIARAQAGERVRYEALADDGSGRVLDATMVPEVGVDGAVRGSFVVLSDVTERKRTELALREREALLALVTENVPMAIGYFDEGSVLRFANLRYAQVLGGVTVADVTGRHVQELIPAERLAEHDPHIERARAGAVVHYEGRPRRDPTRLHETTLVPDLGEDGRVRGLFAVLVDITERHALEEQLRASQKMEAVGTLAGGIAHDFNNILGVILGNVGLARKDAAGQEKVLESLEEIGRAGEQAKRLVQQILAFSRRQPQEMRVRELGPLVGEALRLLRAMVPAVVTLEADLCEGGVYARVDETQVGQVLMNLCTNAWQAMGGRTGRIEVELRQVEMGEGQARGLGLQAGRYACLSVVDDGPGMDQATQARIFEPFFTTKAGKGTGLGLAVVHGIVKGHGGAIGVVSVPGRGTRFEVWLPAVQGVEPTGDRPRPAQEPARQGRGRHVMYVDDNAGMVLLVRRMLEEEGYRVSGYEGAREALQALEADPGAVDLLVTDYNMPGMSGLELAHEASRLRPELPVVVASGFVTEELKAYAAAVGVRHVIHKPDTFDELGRAIDRLASGRDAQES